MYRIIYLFAFLFQFVYCHQFNVKLQPSIDESKVIKLKVPIRQERSSGFHEDEDLTYLCEPHKMVYIEFKRYQPKEVWCEK
jgi:hypothetical protein